MTREEGHRIRYTIALVAEFASKFGLNDRQAFNYLKHHKGIDYLESFYDVLHTLSFDEAIEALTIICQKHGGKLEYYV